MTQALRRSPIPANEEISRMLAHLKKTYEEHTGETLTEEEWLAIALEKAVPILTIYVSGVEKGKAINPSIGESTGQEKGPLTEKG